jgi:hypothetical protein
VFLTRIHYYSRWVPGGVHAENPRRDPARRDDRRKQSNNKGHLEQEADIRILVSVIRAVIRRNVLSSISSSSRSAIDKYLEGVGR